MNQLPTHTPGPHLITKLLLHSLWQCPTPNKINPPQKKIGPHLVREYAPALLQATLDLLTPGRMIVMAVAKAYEGKTTMTEEWCVTVGA